ncbi:unnamed protein product [Acanthocheilonema viteae]|uniref:Uncharacterized protein n=1 Tax=Acanthocheilonema viteae TaxID=6277 RepID=A0A498RXF5_ACAVI|nr:unnamed protein product [Acanthocheilonema viteae]
MKNERKVPSISDFYSKYDLEKDSKQFFIGSDYFAVIGISAITQYFAVGSLRRFPGSRAMGDTGVQGYLGPEAIHGPRGQQGLSGEQGVEGDTGPQGAEAG